MPTKVQSAAPGFLSADPRVFAVEAKIRELLKDAGPLQPVLDYVASTRGKRLRPLLTMLTGEACSATTGTPLDRQATLEVATVFELVHMASLVHDDIIDGATERRGLPTAHIIWGLHAAVLAGDYLFTRANKVALRYGGIGIASLVNQAIELTCEGEVEQDGHLFDATVSEQEYLSHICRKTAALMGASCQAGAALAHAGRDLEEAMLRFGIELGCAFQIADDVVDLTCDGKVSGKSECNDLKRGLLTLPLILAMSGPARTALEQAFARREVGDGVVAEVRTACRDGGHNDRARESARQLADSAKERLLLLAPCEARTALTLLARGVAGSQA